MSLVIGEHITHAFGAEEVFKDVSFRVHAGDRVGLIGPNGEGKTTLLRIIGGLLEPTIGQVHRTRGVTLGYLPQDPPALDGSTISAAMLDVFAEVRRMEHSLADLAARMAAEPSNEDLHSRYDSVQAEYEARGGYGYQNRIEQVLTGLGFGRDMWERPLSKLSGGQRTRAYLAMLLLQEPDVLMLDEPTNHLDMDSVEWLEKWLQGFKGTILVVSHDRYFLDRVTNSTWEISRGAIEVYRGPYSHYLVQREERRKEAMRRWEVQQEYIAKTEEFIRIHLAGQRTKEAQGRRTRLERFLKEEAISRPPTDDSIRLALSAGRRAGDIVLRTENLAIGYDTRDILMLAGDLQVGRGCKVAVVGPNGAGKTTLLRTLLGEIAPLDGSVKLGAGVEVGYLSQTHAHLDPSQTALDAVVSASRGVSEERARSLLGSLLLSGDDVFKRVGDLSGGQRSRVVLARLVLQTPSLLVLDEPTNHLDMPSMEIIEDALRRYDGTLLFVSHDRRLVERVATDVWAIDGGEIVTVRGGWEGYLAWRGARQASAEIEADGKTARAAKEERKAGFIASRKQSNEARRLRRRHEEIEARIEALEREIGDLYDHISFASASGRVDDVNRLSREYQEKETLLKDLWVQWEELGEKLEE